MIFQKIIFLTNNKELVTISRKDGIKRKRSSDYNHTYYTLEEYRRYYLYRKVNL